MLLNAEDQFNKKMHFIYYSFPESSFTILRVTQKIVFILCVWMLDTSNEIEIVFILCF